MTFFGSNRSPSTQHVVCPYVTIILKRIREISIPASQQASMPVEAILRLYMLPQRLHQSSLYFNLSSFKESTENEDGLGLLVSQLLRN